MPRRIATREKQVRKKEKRRRKQDSSFYFCSFKEKSSISWNVFFLLSRMMMKMSRIVVLKVNPKSARQIWKNFFSSERSKSFFIFKEEKQTRAESHTGPVRHTLASTQADVKVGGDATRAQHSSCGQQPKMKNITKNIVDPTTQQQLQEIETRLEIRETHKFSFYIIDRQTNG